MTPKQFNEIKTAVAQALPADWIWRLREDGSYVVLTVEAAPTDLLALNRKAYPDSTPRPGYAVICPTAYETPWDDASAAVIAAWRALHTGCTVKFDRQGERAGRFHFVQMWIGTPGKPFAVLSQ
jgi:hypothetical protein